MTDDGLILRDVMPADIHALAELHVRTFRETHGGGPDAAVREHQWRSKLESRTLAFCILLQGREGELVGFASGERYQSEQLPEFQGELDKIYVLREHQDRGCGAMLLRGAVERFLAASIESMLLFGDARSPSNGFYEHFGAERLYSPTGEFHGAYGWRNLKALQKRLSPDGESVL